ARQPGVVAPVQERRVQLRLQVVRSQRARRPLSADEGLDPRLYAGNRKVQRVAIRRAPSAPRRAEGVFDALEPARIQQARITWRDRGAEVDAAPREQPEPVAQEGRSYSSRLLARVGQV